jgi:hypothetical protein
MTTPEGKVKNAISYVLDRYEHYRFMPVQTGYGAKTIDYLVCVKQRWGGFGIFLGIEAKKAGEEPTPLQEATLRDIRRAGGITITIAGIEEVQKLEEFLRHVACPRQPQA